MNLLGGFASEAKCRFVARQVSSGRNEEVGFVEFFKEVNIPFEDMTGPLRRDAQKALNELDESIVEGGWRRVPTAGAWYSRRYERAAERAVLGTTISQRDTGAGEGRNSRSDARWESRDFFIPFRGQFTPLTVEANDEGLFIISSRVESEIRSFALDVKHEGWEPAEENSARIRITQKEKARLRRTEFWTVDGVTASFRRPKRS